MWENSRLGLYALQAREVVDFSTCPMMSPALEQWFIEFRQRDPGVLKGSVRLRVSPRGERGVWLDFSNQAVKMLFEEREYLQWLSARAFVEIGQRRKTLSWVDGKPRLVDPTLKPWFETYDENFRAIPLYGPVAGFSQAGFAANRVLVEAVAQMVAASGVRDWLELFSGNGNFALALSARGYEVEAFELEPLATQGLALSAVGRSLKVQCRDVYLKSLPSFAGRGLLVDPPRAGLREVLEQVRKSLPTALVYVSCFTEVFLQEATRLEALGFALKQLVGVDQFPYTPHMEWIALFEVEKPAILS